MELRSGHVESPRDPYVPPSRTQSSRPTTVRSRDGHVSVQVNVDALGNDIPGDAANEPSIAVDPTDLSRMAIGWRQFDNVLSDFRQAGWGYTVDAGRSWVFPGAIDPGVFRSDPVLDSDADGNFFYNSLTADSGPSNFRCHVYKSVDGGQTWDSGAYAHGGDKQWQAIDRTDGIGRGAIYAAWNSTFSSCSGNFTRSYDGGQTFLPCSTVAGDPYWGTLDVGPDGALYVSGTGMTVAKSTTMQDSSQPAAWDFTRFVDLDGSLSFSTGPNPGGLLGQAWVAVDHSDGPTQGNVYMLASVNRSSNPDPLDVMFASSTDGGLTWNAPVRVNDDPGTSAWQWFGTMSVAPNGRIDVVWLDTRNDPGGYDSELYYSFSVDGGATWSANEALSPAFDPHLGWPQQSKMGDYFDMVSDELGANLAYAATFNGEQNVYFIRIGEPACPDAGRLTLDRPVYGCDQTLGVELLDCGLNTDDDVVETLSLQVDSDSETGIEQVDLVETSPASAFFKGTIPLSETDAPGVLLVTGGDTITVSYVDADDGEGGTNVLVTAVAPVECTPPVISNVQASGITGQGALVTWNTDEPADSLVTYGTPVPDLTSSVGGLVTSHAVELSGLEECSLYAFSVTSVDEAGNSATDDNAGAFYGFETGKNVVPTYTTLDPPASIPDNDPAGAEQTILVPDDEPIVDLDVQVFVTHTYDGDLELLLVGPDGTEVVLSDRNGGSGNGFDGTIFDDEAGAPIGSGSAPFNGSFQPDESLSIFDEMVAAGEWKLRVVDHAGADTGSIDSFSLILTYTDRLCGPSMTYDSYVMTDSCSGFGAGGQNGKIEPAEDALLELTVRNDGTDPTSGVSARLSTSTPGVTITSDFAQYPDLQPGESASNPLSRFAFTVDAGVECGAAIQFTVDASANEGDWSSSLTMFVGGTDAGALCVACFVPIPGAVPDLGWTDTVDLQWPSVGGAKFYNLYRGEQAGLPNLLDASVDSCKRLSTPGLTTGAVLHEVPQTDSIFWYLVLAGNGGGQGAGGDASDGPRIVDDLGACP